MEEINMDFRFNNKGLVRFFPGTVVTKKKMKLGQINGPMLAKAIRSSDRLKDYTNFELLPEDITLEGEYNSWSLGVKIKVY